jgi:hypothetical protein
MTQWGLDTLFNPAKRHMDEEKRRLQATREEIGDSSGGKRIDLESGKVTIKRASKPKPDVADEAADATADGMVAETETETETDADTKTGADTKTETEAD